jgi:hypothetical protein
MIRYRPVRNEIAAMSRHGYEWRVSEEIERAVVAAWMARDADLVAELINADLADVEHIIHRINVYRPEDAR